LLLQDELVLVVKVEISRLWKSFPENTHFLVKFWWIICYYRSFCRHKAIDRRSSEAMLREELSRLQGELQRDPTNSASQASLDQWLKQLEKFKESKLNRQRLRARVKWCEYGDFCKKEFFKAVKSRHSKARIYELARHDGSSTSDFFEMSVLCWDFYSTLYSNPGPSAGEYERINVALQRISKKVTQTMNSKLCVPIELDELERAMKAMACEKAPGPDGIMIELFKTFWHLVGPDYLSMIKRTLVDANLPSSIVRGLITLLHKGGDHLPLGNYRPITLLNCIYKFFTKLLQRRLQPVLVEVINPDQSAFLPRRYILDNIVVTHETINWAKTSKQPLVLLKLDFAKAYD
jgi:hypothetical protein